MGKLSKAAWDTGPSRGTGRATAPDVLVNPAGAVVKGVPEQLVPDFSRRLGAPRSTVSRVAPGGTDHGSAPAPHLCSRGSPRGPSVLPVCPPRRHDREAGQPAVACPSGRHAPEHRVIGGDHLRVEIST